MLGGRGAGGVSREFHTTRPAEKRDFYDVLGLQRGADKSEVSAPCLLCADTGMI